MKKNVLYQKSNPMNDGILIQKYRIEEFPMLKVIHNQAFSMLDSRTLLGCPKTPGPEACSVHPVVGYAQIYIDHSPDSGREG